MNIQMFTESNGNKLVEHNSLTQVYKAIYCVVMYKKNYPVIQPCRELHVCVCQCVAQMLNAFLQFLC